MAGTEAGPRPEQSQQTSGLVPRGRGAVERPGGRPQLLSIGAVLGVLREAFPEVTISKIRFLEAEGLVEPQRTPSGYRKFSEQDLERLAYVLRMQRDHYLPLRVIREHLEAMGRGEAPPALPASPTAGTGPIAEAEREASALAEALGQAGAGGEGGAAGLGADRLSREDLLAAAGIGEQQLQEWESYGLVAAGPDGGYDADVVHVSKLVAELGRFGLEPRHLRAVKAAADREIGLVEQVVAPLRRHRNPQTRAHAAATARELATLSVRLHAALVQSGLRAHPGG